MARTQRYAHYQYAPWPDPALLAALGTLAGDFFILVRLEQSLGDLVVELSDNRYDPMGDDSAALSEGRHSRLLRLSWAFENRVYALESYDEFYAGPLLAYHPHHQGVQSRGLYEVVSEPNPWIAEIVAENSSPVFPSYGLPIMDERGWHGRYHAANAPLSDSGTVDVHVWTTLTQPTPAELQAATAQARARVQERWQAQKARPRYRHLILVTGTAVLEVLCNDLPQWEWVRN